MGDHERDLLQDEYNISLKKCAQAAHVYVRACVCARVCACAWGGGAVRAWACAFLEVREGCKV